jgi:RNA polymerase sigma factor (sigma-70 family)
MLSQSRGGREEVPGQMTGEVPSGGGAEDPTAEDRTAEDRTLLARLRAGDDAAFGELFSRHSAAVYRLGMGLVNDRAEAEDLTAEAFFRVLQAIRRGSGPVDNVRGYLLIVARRVAWEWSLRRRDVPVTDEELTHRAASDPDTSGAFTERSLIRRAFISLPERWRNVLWKMEVEGERPAAVANNFGLSPNATAALARRARQGLRAAYLQAHLAADRSATGCRSVLEKLGAYTAGSTSGIEYRRIRSHLAGCASCNAMHAELRDVCSGLRAHAGYLGMPAAVAVGTLAAQAATEATVTAGAGGIGIAVKGLLATVKIQVTLAVGSAAAVGVFGLTTLSLGGDGAANQVDLAGKRPVELRITAPSTTTPAPPLRAARGELSTQHAAPATRERPATTEPRPVAPTSSQPPAPDGGASSSAPQEIFETFDELAPILYRETTVERSTELEGELTVVRETTTVTEKNSLDQTRTTTYRETYTQTPPPETARTVEPTASSSAPDGP